MGKSALEKPIERLPGQDCSSCMAFADGRCTVKKGHVEDDWWCAQWENRRAFAGVSFLDIEPEDKKLPRPRNVSCPVVDRHGRRVGGFE